MKSMTEACTRKGRTGWRRRMWWEEPEGKDSLLRYREDSENSNRIFIVSRVCQESCEWFSCTVITKWNSELTNRLKSEAECKYIILCHGVDSSFGINPHLQIGYLWVLNDSYSKSVQREPLFNTWVNILGICCILCRCECICNIIFIDEFEFSFLPNRKLEIAFSVKSTSLSF